MSTSPAINAQHKTQTRGFSLIEILTATAILVFIVAILGALSGATSKLWRDVTGGTKSGLNARAIADFIQTDLKSALLPIDSDSTNSLQFILNSTNVPTAYMVGDSLFWQAPVANNTTYGDVAEVGYFVKWITNSAGSPQPILCRFFVEPTDSTDTSSNYLIYQNPSAWLNQATIDAVAPGTANQGYRGLFAENVVAIWFRCLDKQGKAFPWNFDSRVGANDSNGDLRRLPASVQVSFIMIDPTIAPRLSTSHQSSLVDIAGDVASDIASSGTNDSTISPAQLFMEKVISDPSLKAILEGLTPHTTVVSLLNAP